jgi:hypothetical protein
VVEKIEPRILDSRIRSAGQEIQNEHPYRPSRREGRVYLISTGKLLQRIQRMRVAVGREGG